MEEITALTRTLNLLASIRHEDDPTIDELLAAVPGLQKMDWINRFGPARAWESVASDIETDALEWLTKALVIAEREFDWIGGSVAAPIWLYQAYSTRVGADADALANWVLRNRGCNEYIPFWPKDFRPIREGVACGREGATIASRSDAGDRRTAKKGKGRAQAASN